jgi:hypothetical protein
LFKALLKIRVISAWEMTRIFEADPKQREEKNSNSVARRSGLREGGLQMPRILEMA